MSKKNKNNSKSKKINIPEEINAEQTLQTPIQTTADNAIISNNRDTLPSIHYLDFFVHVVPQGSQLTHSHLKEKINIAINTNQIEDILKSCTHTLAKFYQVDLKTKSAETSYQKLLYPSMLTNSNNQDTKLLSDLHDFQKLISSLAKELETKITSFYPADISISLVNFIASEIFNNLFLLGIHPLLILLTKSASLLSPSTIESLITDPRSHNSAIELDSRHPSDMIFQMAYNILFNSNRVIEVLNLTRDFNKDGMTSYINQSLEHAIIFSNTEAVKKIIDICIKNYQVNSPIFDSISHNIGLAIIRGNLGICPLLLQKEIYNKLSAIDKAYIIKLIILRSGSIARSLLDHLINNELLTSFIAINAIDMGLNESEREDIQMALTTRFSASLKSINELATSQYIARSANALRYLILKTDQAEKYLKLNPPSAELFLSLSYLSDKMYDTLTIFEALKPYCESILIKQDPNEIMDGKMQSLIMQIIFALADLDYITELMEKLNQANILSAKLYYNIINSAKHSKANVVKFFKPYLLKILNEILIEKEDSLLSANALIHTIDNIPEEEAIEFIRNHYELIRNFMTQNKKDVESINSQVSTHSNVLSEMMNKVKNNLKNKAKAASKKKSLESKKSVQQTEETSLNEISQPIEQEIVAEVVTLPIRNEVTISSYQAPHYIVTRTEYYYPISRLSMLPPIVTPEIHSNFENQAKNFQLTIFKIETIQTYNMGLYAYTLKKVTNLLTDEITQNYVNPNTGEVISPSSANSQAIISSQSAVKNHAVNQYSGEDSFKKPTFKISQNIEPQELILIILDLDKAKPEFIEQKTYNESIVEIEKRTEFQYASINYQPLEKTKDDDSMEFNNLYNSSYSPALPLESQEHVITPFYITEDPLLEGKMLGEGLIAF